MSESDAPGQLPEIPERRTLFPKALKDFPTIAMPIEPAAKPAMASEIQTLAPALEPMELKTKPIKPTAPEVDTLVPENVPGRTPDKSSATKNEPTALNSNSPVADTKAPPADLPYDLVADGPTQRLPELLDRYVLGRPLGEGSMGKVYLGLDRQLNRQVAIKLAHEAASDAKGARRLLFEARAAARLEHANICRIYDVCIADGTVFIVMQYVAGTDLGHVIRVQGAMPPEIAVATVAKIARAMDYAHRCGVVHRDLKPQNIALREDGEPIVMDFGIARVGPACDAIPVTAGRPLGTPPYMPPEQVVGDWSAIGPASDVYSLGGILFELLTGRVPFHGELKQVLRDILYSAPPRLGELLPDADSELEAIVQKCLQKRPQDRFGSMANLADRLDEFAESRAAGTPPNRVRLGGLLQTATSMLSGAWRDAERKAKPLKQAAVDALKQTQKAIAPVARLARDTVTPKPSLSQRPWHSPADASESAISQMAPFIEPPAGSSSAGPLPSMDDSVTGISSLAPDKPIDPNHASADGSNTIERFTFARHFTSINQFGQFLVAHGIVEAEDWRELPRDEALTIVDLPRVVWQLHQTRASWARRRKLHFGCLTKHQANEILFGEPYGLLQWTCGGQALVTIGRISGDAISTLYSARSQNDSWPLLTVREFTGRLDPETTTPAERQQFDALCQLLISLHHPHLPRLRDLRVNFRGQVFAISEFVLAFTLEELLEQPVSTCTHRITVESAVALVLRIAWALQFAEKHRRQRFPEIEPFGHGSITESQIVISENGDPMLLGHGMAKLASLLSHDDMSITEVGNSQSPSGTVSPDPIKDIADLLHLLKRLINKSVSYPETDRPRAGKRPMASAATWLAKVEALLASINKPGGINNLDDLCNRLTAP